MYRKEADCSTGLTTRAREIVRQLGRVYPDAGIALVYNNPFELLVAAVLSAQCTDRRVNLITARLFQKFRTPQDFASLTPEVLAEEIKGCGLHHSKSRYITELSRTLLELYSGNVPDRREQLETLPGVGRKVAGVVLGVAYGADTMPVDTHVFRLARRLGLSGGKSPEQVEQDLLSCFAPGSRQPAHHLLIRHGREICSARRPRCEECVIFSLCPREGLAQAGGGKPYASRRKGSRTDAG